MMKVWWLKYVANPSLLGPDLEKKLQSGTSKIDIINSFSRLITDEKHNATQLEVFYDLMVKSIVHLSLTRREIRSSIYSRIQNEVWKRLVQKHEEFRSLYLCERVCRYVEDGVPFDELTEKNPDYHKLSHQEMAKRNFEMGEKYIRAIENDSRFFNEIGEFYFHFADFSKALEYFVKSNNVDFQNRCRLLIKSKRRNPQLGILDLEKNDFDFLKKYLEYGGTTNFENVYQVKIDHTKAYCQYRYMGIQLLKQHLLNNRFPTDYDSLRKFIPPPNQVFHHLLRSKEHDCLIVFYFVFFCVKYLPNLLGGPNSNLLGTLYGYYRVYSPLLTTTFHYYFPKRCFLPKERSPILTPVYIDRCCDRILPGHPVIPLLRSELLKKPSTPKKMKTDGNITGSKRPRKTKSQVETKGIQEQEEEEEEEEEDFSLSADLNHQVLNGTAINGRTESSNNEFDFTEQLPPAKKRRLKPLHANYLVSMARHYRYRDDLGKSHSTLQTALAFHSIATDNKEQQEKAEKSRIIPSSPTVELCGNSIEYDVVLLQLMEKVRSKQKGSDNSNQRKTKKKPAGEEKVVIDEEVKTLKILVNRKAFPNLIDVGSILRLFVELDAWDGLYAYFHHFLTNLGDTNPQKNGKHNNKVLFLAQFALSLHQVVRVGGREAIFALLDSLLQKGEAQVELLVKWEVFHLISRKIVTNMPFLKKLCAFIALAILSLRKSKSVANKRTLYLDHFQAIIGQDLEEMLSKNQYDLGNEEEETISETYEKWEGIQGKIDVSLLHMLIESLSHLCRLLNEERDLCECDTEEEELIFPSIFTDAPQIPPPPPPTARIQLFEEGSHFEDDEEEAMDNEDESKSDKVYVYFALLGDLYFETQRFREALKYYFEAIRINTKNFNDNNSSNLLSNVVFVKRITHCLNHYGKFTISMVFDQFIADNFERHQIDQLKTFDVKWICYVFKVPFLELLVYITNWNQDDMKKNQVVQQIERCSLLFHINDNQKRNFRLNSLKSEFLKRVYEEFL